MKIVFVNYYYDEKLGSEMEFLQQSYTVVGWAEALQRLGCDVTVISRFNKNSSIAVNNVKYLFLNDGMGAVLSSTQVTVKFFKAVAALQPDIVHLHHLSLSVQTVVLRFFLPRKTAIIIQHHGGKTVHNWKMSLHNRLHNVADGYFFTTREQGEWWFTKSSQQKKIMPVMEGATFFDFENRDAGPVPPHKETIVSGSPVFLWVGRLDKNKDPLTVLDGFGLLLQEFSQGRLYMIYNEDELISAVKQKIQASQVLKEKVQLLGAVSHNKIQSYYNAADYFVLGSHYEGSGYALSEALRCGCVPIITDIPSFRMMTNDGQLGALWHPGNNNSFVSAARSAVAKPIKEERIKCIEFFKEALSFDAIARIALQYYRQVSEKRKS